MTVYYWITENYQELVELIKSMGINTSDIDMDELENWVLNDEGLYNWALSNGVNDI